MPIAPEQFITAIPAESHLAVTSNQLRDKKTQALYSYKTDFTINHGLLGANEQRLIAKLGDLREGEVTVTWLLALDASTLLEQKGFTRPLITENACSAASGLANT